MSNGFGPLKPVEQVAREHERKEYRSGATQQRVGVKFERVVSGPGAEKEKSISAKTAEIKAKWEAQKAQEKQRGR